VGTGGEGLVRIRWFAQNSPGDCFGRAFKRGPKAEKSA